MNKPPPDFPDDVAFYDGDIWFRGMMDGFLWVARPRVLQQQFADIKQPWAQEYARKLEEAIKAKEEYEAPSC